MSLKIIHSKTGVQIGYVRFLRTGWICFPMTSAHQPSKKRHDTADEAIPDWMKKMGVHIEYPAFGSKA